MNVVTLARVSTRHQAERGYSLSEQHEALAAFCARGGLRVVEHLVDDGVSGRIADRPAIRRALELAEAGAIRAVVLVKIDRLGRENVVIQDLLSRFRGRGLQVLFVEHGGPDTPANRLLLNVLAGIAEFDLEQLRARTMAGRLGKAKRGFYPASLGRYGAPYGYRMVTTAEAAVLPEYAGRSGELLIVEPEAEVVRGLFVRYAAGASIDALTRWLNDELGLRTRSGKRWQPASVRFLLQQEYYAGQGAYGKDECRRVGDGKKQVARTPRDPEEVPRLAPPALVSPALWLRVQEQIAERWGTLRGRPSKRWLLRGAVVCNECRAASGRPLAAQGASQGEKRYYKCNSHKLPDRRYCGASCAAETAETAAEAMLRRMLEPGAYAAHVRALHEARYRQVDHGEADRLRKELEAVEASIARLIDALAVGTLALDLLAPKIEELGGQRDRLKARLSLLQGAAALDLDAVLAAAEQQVQETRDALAADPEFLGDAIRTMLQVRLLARKPPRVLVLG